MINALIPARAGSKRVKNKNVALINGHPLIAYSIIACKLNKLIDRTIVSTECPKIAAIAKKYGAEVPFLRPEKYSQDNSSDVGFLSHFFDEISVDKVLLMRPTTPLRKNNTLNIIIKNYLEAHKKEKFSGFRSMSRSNHSPYKMLKIKEDNCCEGFFQDFMGNKEYTNLPNQTFPKAYIPNGYCDLVLRKTIENDNSTFGNFIFGFETENIIDVDDQFSLDLVDFQINTNYDCLSVHLESFK